MPIIDIFEISTYYERSGSGLPLFIFPDNLLTSQAYQAEVDHFQKRFEVITFDYPGTGKSTHDIKYPDEQEVDYWGFWADLACHLLNELQITQCFCLGIGGGAITALQFTGKQAPQHNILPLGLILDSFLADWDTRTLHRWLDVREHFYVRNQSALKDQHGQDWRQIVDRDTQILRKLAERGGYFVSDSVLNAISCPTLLTGHMSDPILPGIAQEFARISNLIPDCSLFLSSKANHPYLERPFMWTDPESCLKIADHFLSRILV